MKRLQLGKLPIDVLDRTVLKMTGATSEQVVTPPKAGLDFAAVKAGDRFMVISADPITGVTSDIGDYAVTVSANDVATSGNRPQFAESVILLPEGAGMRDVTRIAEQMHLAADRLGISIVGGHTEVTPGLPRPIVVVTAFSFVKDYVSSEDAEEGDTIMMTKTAGIEGTAVISREAARLGLAIPRGLAKRAGRLLADLSIVEEAVGAYQTGCVNAMHDCTEGGVQGAVYEMSLASGLGFVLREGSVPVAPETREICSRTSVDPMRLIGSGSLLLAVERGKEARVKEALKGACRVTEVGQFTNGRRLLVHKDGRETRLRSAPEDELWRIFGGRP